MTDQEKYIYNAFLRITRTRRNLPFKYRKNFNNFESSNDYPFVKKLSFFFIKFPHIKIDDFFSAPYDVYPDEPDHYDLKFYTSQKAIRLYGIYTHKQSTEDPDTGYHLNFIKDSLLYIFRFCRDNGLCVEEYTSHMSGGVHTFIMHLRERHISMYILFFIPGTEQIVSEYSESRLDFTLGKNFTNRLAICKSNIYNSNKAKIIAHNGIQSIKQLLIKAKDKI
jgi:hypothetical protein